MASAVANRYASALVDVVTSAASALKPEDAIAQLQAAAKMVADSAELRNALMTPAIQNSRKRAVIGRLLDSTGTSHLIRNFVFVIIDHRRIAILDEIREAFEVLLDVRMGFVRAEVTSAAALDQQRSAGLESELSNLTGKRMRLRFAVDPELLGGVVAQQLRRQLTGHSAE